jgi:hypothetical protein
MKKKKLTLYPLKFEEALRDLLKVHPEPQGKSKQAKKASQAKK